MDFGEKLKLLIDEKGISVSRLAQMTGINRNTLYSFIRRGTQKIDPVIIHKLAVSLDVDPFYFLDGKSLLICARPMLILQAIRLSMKNPPQR